MIRLALVCLFFFGWSLPAGAQIATTASATEVTPRVLVVNYKQRRIEWRSAGECVPPETYRYLQDNRELLGRWRRAEPDDSSEVGEIVHPSSYGLLTSEAKQGPLVDQSDFRLATLLRHPDCGNMLGREGMVGWRYRTGFGTAYLEVQEHGQPKERITNLFYDTTLASSAIRSPGRSKKASQSTPSTGVPASSGVCPTATTHSCFPYVAPAEGGSNCCLNGSKFGIHWWRTKS